jgi:hypothetical protein
LTEKRFSQGRIVRWEKTSFRNQNSLGHVRCCPLWNRFREVFDLEITPENVRQATDLSEIRGLKREMRPARRESQTALGPLALLLLWPAIFLAACSTAPMPPPAVSHVVLLWLKHPHRLADRDKIVRMAHSLRGIPGVLEVKAGRSIGSVGPNPPRDFDLGVVITFRDRAALQRYERDPRHLEAMRRYLDPLVRHYEVYNLVGR